MSIPIKVLICICSLAFTCANAQSDLIDIAKIHSYDTVKNAFNYYIDKDRVHAINEINLSDFKDVSHKSLFNPKYPGGNYYAQLTITNSGLSDTIFFYAGKGQDYKVYEVDTATGEKKILNNRIQYYSLAVFNKVPFIYLPVQQYERKIILVELNIHFYNWHLFDPILVKNDVLEFFVFDHIFQKSRLYISIALFALGIMFTMFVSAIAFFVRTPVKEYLYYSLAVLIFFMYFSTQMLDVFSFSKTYHWFYEARFESLQLIGAIFILMFVSSFLKFKQEHPFAHKAVQWMIWTQVIFLLVNIPFAYTDQYNFIASVSFDLMRLVVLVFSLTLALYITIKDPRKEAQYLGIGSIISLCMSMLALYVGRKINTEDFLYRYNKIPSLIFMVGILLQVLLFLQGLSYRRRMQEAERIRAVEQLQMENDRKELETYRAIIDARDNERTRISKEIHDDIGSGLTSIRLLSEIAKVKYSDTDNKELEKISSTSNVLIDKMNEIIWTLNSRNDTLLNLIAYLRHQIVEFFEPINIVLEINLPENIQDAPVSGNIRRNIILAVKEALHNIVKHSEASAVRVNFSFDKVFTISIMDNGTGFNPQQVSNHNNGLRNMKERLISVGGSCEFTVNEGTHIIMKIPLLTYPL